MDSTKNTFASVSATFTHGTAKEVEMKPIIPLKKFEKKVFWAKALVESFENKSKYTEVKSSQILMTLRVKTM